MKVTQERGLTLIELLMAIAIMGLIAGAAMSLLSSALQAQDRAGTRTDLYQEGLMILERITGGVRQCTYLLIPNAHNPTRDILAFSGTVNDDDDYYFGDPLFPKIDEDPGSDMNGDSSSGIGLVDDDGDESIDDGGTVDDDEDGLNDEDPLDGIDDDEDGNLDEDFTNDITNDSAPGIKGMDDDGDGSVDEGNAKDDDEDGSFEEDPLNAVVYLFDGGAGTLTEWLTYNGQTLNLSSRVSSFQVSWEAPERILITLTLTNEQGENVSFSEYVCPRNALQKTGKRVR